MSVQMSDIQEVLTRVVVTQENQEKRLDILAGQTQQLIVIVKNQAVTKQVLKNLDQKITLVQKQQSDQCTTIQKQIEHQNAIIDANQNQIYSWSGGLGCALVMASFVTWIIKFTNNKKSGD